VGAAEAGGGLVSGDDFGRVLEQAGEPPAGPRPDGWDTSALLARMLEEVAALRASSAARHAAGAGRRRQALALYQQARAAAGLAPGPVPPWLGEDGPYFRFYGSTEGINHAERLPAGRQGRHHAGLRRRRDEPR
jgi:hypothetical protein